MAQERGCSIHDHRTPSHAPAQRAIAQRFCALALFCRANRAERCPLSGVDRPPSPLEMTGFSGLGGGSLPDPLLRGTWEKRGWPRFRGFFPGRTRKGRGGTQFSRDFRGGNVLGEGRSGNPSRWPPEGGAGQGPFIPFRGATAGGPHACSPAEARSMHWPTWEFAALGLSFSAAISSAIAVSRPRLC